ncbi:hypothetical protein [Ferrovum sp.]|uniref:hypothetical protein n=1 Tax=Ferrovum sp. TaxID=2609467 RepID=UPI002606F1A8|nr:hypothetical protein [Ferrovum sp.]
MTRPQSAPGCFAAASVFSHDSNICNACIAFAQCATESIKTLESIKEMVCVTDIIKQHQKAKKKTEGHRSKSLVEDLPVVEPVDGMPVNRTTPLSKITFEIDEDQNQALAKITNSKGKEQFVVLCKRGLIDDMKRDLSHRVNTFDKGGPKHFRTVVRLLLNGGCTKSEFRRALIDDHQWSDSAASSHVSMLWPGLIAFGLAIEVESRLVLIPVNEN